MDIWTVLCLGLLGIKLPRVLYMHLGDQMESFLLDINLGAELLCHRVSLSLALEDTTKPSQNGFATVHSTSNV